MVRRASTGKLFLVIIAGGSGTRFWPLSRRRRPKQLLPLVTGSPLIADTAARLAALAPPSNTFVVCGKAHAAQVRRMLPRLPKRNVLVEPVARNTAPAIALATAHVASREPNGVVAVLPSDQHVADAASFARALRSAARAAEEGYIVTLGIKPTRPETGYGYIRLGGPVAEGAREASAFVEKPDAKTAQRYLSSGEYLWNAGIFVFRAEVMLRAFREHMPELFEGLERIRSALTGRRYRLVLAREFPRMPSVSIDYGVAEKARNVAVVPGDFGWSDIGSFAAISEVRPADSRGNVVAGEGAIVLDSDGCVVMGGRRPLAVVGMSGAVVVDAGDAVLVLPKDRCQDVRKVVEALKERKLEDYL
ncbi:MAG: mannose-1-phosphate guanylyltransferase [Myxococcales bacterium]|nr:mannose-1-phosphate guanylyltransferase [Myxococcales bacterium]